MSKKVLIIGNSASAYALAKYLSKSNDVYVAPGSPTIKEFANIVDIREDSVLEILEFVLENGIELTIPVSQKAISTNIVEFFEKNNLQVFSPMKDVANSLFDRTIMKKILYRLRIPTPKFGIFEKQNMANDYLKNQKVPFVIKTNETSSAVVITAQSMAKSILDTYFAKQQKVLIEDYVWGIPFTFYVMTDGYKALPLGSSITYKHSLDGEGGQLTSGMGAGVPNYKFSNNNEDFLFSEVIYPLLEYFEAQSVPYCGILGVNGVLADDETLHILGFQSFMNDCDATAILELLDEDLISLMQSCIIGSFSDEVDLISTKNLSSTSIVLTCNNKENIENIIEGLDFIDEDIVLDFYPQVNKNKYLEYEADHGQVLVLTAFGRTITSSTSKVYEAASQLNYRGIHYRKDICKQSKSEFWD